MSPIGPSRQAAFFRPTVANGALRTWLDCSLPHPVAHDPYIDVLVEPLKCRPQVGGGMLRRQFSGGGSGLAASRRMDAVCCGASMRSLF